ncbi:SNF1-related protein kinase regulatory subunit beta-1-like isoform X2 [Phragmites australis]|uniref:SNF1-related protein kinase regulatory subunit beta-1-like isoform X2 n=1 Tax=Phragmites australis TaxID=29695 RepID=UPI002D78B618|nr:SNF1-related protein kinase regulatory subunit beta-1-like isoform X2 [Phragmites australis]
MGNASAKEEGNGHMAASPEPVSADGGTSSVEAAAAQPPPLSPPDAVMLEQPPPVPYLFAPQDIDGTYQCTAPRKRKEKERKERKERKRAWQCNKKASVPVTPLQRPTEFSPVFNHSPINGSDEPNNSNPQEKGIPTLIAWNQGGTEVFLEGSWDNWTSRAFERSGKDHTILLVLPSGVYHYRIIVDGELRYVPELPHVTDERGQVANLLDVHDYVPESLDSVAEFEAPPSPEHSYDLQFLGDEEFAKEPPTLPPQLLTSVLCDTDNTNEQTPKPQHVVLDHLFIEKGWGSQSLLALGVTHRFQSKYVSFVLYKPLRR